MQHSAPSVNGSGFQGAPFSKQSSFGPIGGGVPVAAPSGSAGQQAPQPQPPPPHQQQQFHQYGGSPFVPTVAPPGPISPLGVNASVPGPIGAPPHNAMPPPHHEIGGIELGMRGMSPPLQQSYRDTAGLSVCFLCFVHYGDGFHNALLSCFSLLFPLI